MTWIVLQHNNLSILIGAVYRPPNSDISVLETLHDYLSEYCKRYTHVILCGDFNLPKIDWDRLSADSNCRHSELLLDTVFSFNLTQLVRTPTRLTPGTSSILNLIFVSEAILGYNNTIEIQPGISDHELVLFHSNMLCIRSTPVIRKYLEFNAAPDESILDLLELEFDKFHSEYNNTVPSVDALWTRFKNIVHKCITYVPIKKKKTC